MVSRVTSFRFPGTAAYWESRYARGGHSGFGSRGQLAQFKAKIINEFVRDKSVRSVIEFGCGDGHQLSLGEYGTYIGLDVSPTALALCRQRFYGDQTKSFFLYHSLCFVDHAGLFRADLALSLDVLFHLVEDDIYAAYMNHLFDSANRFVIVYSANFDAPQRFHVRWRHFTPWIEQNRTDWRLLRTVNTPYPYNEADRDRSSFSDFYVYEKKQI
ncbi:MAG: class I SAM-dependent methyltransferase [Kiritimatiellae bacterium]|nr:class I SAM-dependent methyltransferase [Kiritimatiellia bacterium]